MRAEEIRKAMNAAPFRKITLHLANGRKLTVNHRDFISVNPSGRTVVVHKLNDSWEAIDVRLINSIEFHAGKNGRRRKPG
jgi:uncharacterized protein Veg